MIFDVQAHLITIRALFKKRNERPEYPPLANKPQYTDTG